MLGFLLYQADQGPSLADNALDGEGVDSTTTGGLDSLRQNEGAYKWGEREHSVAWQAWRNRRDSRMAWQPTFDPKQLRLSNAQGRK